MALPVGFGGGQPPKASEKNGEKQTARMSGRQVLTTSLDRRVEAMLARSNQVFKALQQVQQRLLEAHPSLGNCKVNLILCYEVMLGRLSIL